ncbi:MAG: NADH-quinone oxidoreductase subunit 5 family protein [Leptospirales bacterium]
MAMQDGAAVLLPALPLLGGLLLFLFDACGVKSPRTALIALVSTALSFFLGLFVLWGVISSGPLILRLPVTLPGLTDGPLWGVDRLSAIMVLLVTGVSTVVQAYSLRYILGEPDYGRFFSLVAAETSVLVMLVTSRNLLLIFVFWQLMSLGLYLLMAHNRRRRNAVDTAGKTFLVHRAGDMFMLAGILIAHESFHTLDLGRIADILRDSPAAVSQGTLAALVLCIFVGCMAKSAQFPFHFWLPDTMETPTPVSALMHAGIVNAGGYLMNRTSILFAHSPLSMHLVFAVGFLTALFGSSTMLTQSDVKRKLGFSTMGQMGYMTMECGLGAFSLAVFHLIAHGIFKATLFLESGTAIAIARKDPSIPRRMAEEPATPEGFHLSRALPVALVTLVLPLVIVLGAHQLADIHLSREEGTVVFLFFSWVTVSQVTISLTRARLFDSFAAAIPWTAVLVLFVYGYIGAAHKFNLFLYPDPVTRALFFSSGGVGWVMFTPIVLLITSVIVAGWVVAFFRGVRGRQILPPWILSRQEALYLFFLNRGSVEHLLLHRVVEPVDRLLWRLRELFDGKERA